jgi:uncharacterized membrane protein YhaH (DUF805 family)
MTCYIKALRNYANFKGRASRKEFWMFHLFLFLILIAAFVLDAALGTIPENGEWGLFSAVVYLAHIVPSISLTVRRLHDLDKSGWFILIFLIPVVGPIMWLVWMLSAGTPGENRYGPPPSGC